MAIPQQASILHRWKLDEISGNRADSVGTCTLTDNATVGYSDSCKQGYYSADFEETNAEYLSATAASSSDMNFTSSNFSVAFWVKPENLDIDTYIKRGTHAVDGWYIQHYTSRLRFYTSQASVVQEVISSINPITSGNFSHISIIRNGSSGYIYVDGANKTETSPTLINPVATNSVLYIGRYSSVYPENDVDGLMDDIIIWNVALTSTEVLALYNTYPIASGTGRVPYLGARDSAMYKELE